MIRIELPVLVSKLNPISKQILEECAATCMNEQYAEITVPNLLLSFLSSPLNDIRIILSEASIDVDELKTLLKENSEQTRLLDVQQNYPVFSPLLVELLQDSWLTASTEFNLNTLRSGIILYVLLGSVYRYLPNQAAKILISINRELLKQDFVAKLINSAETENTTYSKESSRVGTKSDSLLAMYAQNVTELARQGKIDPVLCRDKEIDLMIDILSRRRKNNPIVVGEAGVGKSALIEGLALRIVSENVPESMLNTELMNLDLGALQAGAAVKGEFEKRFKGIMKEVNESIKPIILFIDEAHTLIGAGNQSGGLDVSNLLKPALARGELKTIAATTWSEYKKYFEKDAALSRRFQLVKLEPPSVNDAIVIMRGLRATYEEAHKVLIEEDALISVVELSERYLSGRQLPDKAIDVLDTACARVSINLTSPPKLISELSNNRHKIEMEVALLDRELLLGLSQNKDRLSELKKELKKIDKTETKLRKDWLKQQEIVRQIVELRRSLLEKASSNSEINKEDKNNSLSSEENKQIAKLTSLSRELERLQKTQVLVSPHVTQKQIATVIAEWTGVPLDKLSQNELNVITELPSYLTKEIKGQELAIKHLHKHLLTARADLRRTGRPLGAFLLVGPSGVGKTETVIQIADLLFGGKQYLTTINMSEFQEKHTVSRLIGSPPGYVGYGEGGVLTEAIRRKPYSVVLLDEVEKAHPDVLNLFYQAFDKGELADGEGRIIDCKNIVFFLTSNLGYQTIVDNADVPEKINDELYPELSEFFKPALLARMEVIPYLPLPREVLKIIIDGKLAKLSNLLERRFEAKIIIDEQVKEEILNRATRAENGARILESIIDGQMLPPVSLLLLQKMSQNEEIKKIQFMIKDNKFVAKVGENECDLA
ncbi:type VI secretion system ATPase TssH [Haemophilus parainfluenzae]|jgi:type VI secretion ATPase, clpV1 family|uniref:Type VI secretion system ATPase TssH n=1 Tax=Haemophilus parainfluenzae TaxID=729 RepID=A0A7M1NVP9_HAEPA|nr:type VI secretion system ATPase TssH [Haemophilus parainfluenzae]QOR17025.1 type VI secretion system ATPase TssH [Haemophilus parainfluenzae]